MFVIILTISTVYITCKATVTPIACESNFRGCCPDTVWNNKTQTCEACMDGYHGENCSIPCPHPFFGKECQMKCNCSEDLCDISKGCPIETTGIHIILESGAWASLHLMCPTKKPLENINILLHNINLSPQKRQSLWRHFYIMTSRWCERETREEFWTNNIRCSR